MAKDKPKFPATPGEIQRARQAQADRRFAQAIIKNAQNGSSACVCLKPKK